MYVLFELESQIRFILLQNRQGKTRLAKYYVPLEDSEKHKVEYEVILAILSSIRFLIDIFFWGSFLILLIFSWLNIVSFFSWDCFVD